MSSTSKPTTSPEASGSARIKQEPSKAEGNAAASESKKNSTATTDDKSGEDSNGGIITPHDHDVLSGRGNSVNHHPGNEYFRSLVRHHKLAYVRCPKPQKEQFSKLIVSTVRDREPPGRFLKQNTSTKLWYNIGTQKALDKTRQALREGAPATVAGLMLSQGLTPSHAAAAGLTPSQAVSTLSSVSGENELIGNSAGGAASNSSNPFLGHPHAHAAAVASQQQQHHLAAAAHSRMVNSSYYNAAAAAAAAGGIASYPNSPKPPSGAAKEPTEATSSNAAKAGQPPPQSPQTNSRLPPTASAPYPPPTAGSDEAMKYHAAQVVRMAAAAHAVTGNGTSGSNSSSGSNFGSSAALAAAAGTFNPVLLEHIMAQHRGGSVPPPSDWNSARQPAPAAGGRDSYYPGYPPAPGSGQHEDIHAKCQRQEAYIAHLQERIQQQERQLLTLCSHILLSPPGPPPPGGAGSMGVNPTPPTTGSSSHPAAAAAAAAASSPLHNGISHPQYAAAAKMNAATAVANINATAAAVKEIQSYANAGDRSRLAVTAGSKSPVPFSGAAPPSAAAVPAAASKAATATNGTAAPAKDKTATTPSKSPSPAQEKASDDGDAVAALLALGIGKSPTGSSPTAAAAPAAGAPESEDSNASKKKRKHSAGRRTLPLKKKQIQQENSKAAAAAAASTYHQQLHAAQQQQQHQQHMPQPPPPRQQQAPQKALPMNAMMMPPNSRAVIPKPPVDMGQAPELYLYGEAPIHEPHVHDVLCGRGALTNEHPGNEWFRRLVRSNRQLYRSCPKHTKLLVAKAIVQAVQRTQRNPPGRFLEKTKTSDGSVSNSWTPITYKSAVEKASQALREKVTPNWGAPPSNFPLSKALEAARAVAYLEKEYPSGDGFGGTNLLALIMAVVQSAGLD
eukprot:CAMPEP_0116123108 /NCGR_PEP_ID=MMETSP0329-20121206/4570_1 /TAXON_ID=697910 /ORGANISM="Pseudo-nitzschia arenysensis, Strain B593" /LENGTH=900 /DNA_ID=CAMNT_0003616997 /DNA_START=154 /DNA_END=2856 /DNA_ORIENTATION=-